MTAFNYFDVEPPTKWQACTSLVDGRPLYFPCADCGQKDAEIAGVIAISSLDHAPRFSEIGIMPDTLKSAMFCSACYAVRLEQNARRMQA